MKKVMFFIESLAGGGAEKALVNLLNSLDKNKYETYVYTVTDEDLYQKDVESLCHYRSFLHKKMYEKGGFSKLLFWAGIKFIYHAPVSLVYRLFVKEEFDIEVAYIEGFATKLISSSKNLNSKKYAWVHIDTTKNEYADRSFANMEEQIKTYTKYNRIICVSDTVRDVFIRKYKIDKSIEVIHNLNNTEEIINKAKEKLDLPPNESLQMIAIGRLEQQKGFIRLIEDLNRIKNRDYSLWILGEGSQRKKLEEKIEEYDLTNNVKLLGFQQNPYKFLSKSDALICSSYAEGYSTVITESLLLGVPVFAVECSGVVEQLEGGVLGKIVSNTDEGLFQMLYELINNPSIVKNFKQKKTNRILESQTINLEKIERLLDE